MLAFRTVTYCTENEETPKRHGLTAMVVMGLPAGLMALTVHEPINAAEDSPGIDFVIAPRSMTWSASLQHCASLKAKVATLDAFLSIHAQHPDALTVSDHWILPATSGPKPPSPMLLSMSRLASMSASNQADPLAVMASKGVVRTSKVNPLQAQRFVCISLPEINGESSK